MANEGRKTILNKELIKELCGYISNGNSVVSSVALCNISQSVYYQWIQKAESDNEKGKQSIYVEFLDNIKKAREMFKAWNIQNIRNAGQDKKHWQASAWLLERTFPEEYGRKDSLKIRGGLNVANFDVKLTPEQEEAYNQRLKDMYGDDLPDA